MVEHVCRQFVAIEFLSSLLLAGVPVLLLAQLRHKREKGHETTGIVRPSGRERPHERIITVQISRGMGPPAEH
jgi:hypothetical protein